MKAHFMPYSVREVFYSLQGEGAHTGRPSVFIRFTGCNLWSGHEADRDRAICRICDTEFVGGIAYPSAARLALAAHDRWPGGPNRWAILTGGEPSLQADAALLTELHSLGFEVAIETNGTRSLPSALDWITVSPKAGTEIVQRSGSELKVLWPQEIDLDACAAWDFERRYLQPIDGPQRQANVAATVQAVLRDPRWRLSLQVHKVLGIR